MSKIEYDWKPVNLALEAKLPEDFSLEGLMNVLGAINAQAEFLPLSVSLTKPGYIVDLLTEKYVEKVFVNYFGYEVFQKSLSQNGKYDFVSHLCYAKSPESAIKICEALNAKRFQENGNVSNNIPNTEPSEQESCAYLFADGKLVGIVGDVELPSGFEEVTEDAFTDFLKTFPPEEPKVGILTNPEPPAQNFCPDCGSIYFTRQTANRHKCHCDECGNSWYDNVDYELAIRSNLKARFEK